MASVIKAVESLCPGMVVDKEVSSRGTVLLKAGTPISEAHIGQLRKWNITTVSVSDKMADPSQKKAEAPLPSFQHDEQFLRETKRIEDLFAAVDDDKQMLILKDCFLKHLEGH
jgi:hypothetical protein